MKKLYHLAPSRILLLGFMNLILMGTILLMMPFSSQTNSWTPFMDALFTSTSAACVTGLIVVDTATHWSLIGQFIIMCLIQIGGLGIATITIGLIRFTGKKISFKSRLVMKESISAPTRRGMVKIVGFIIKSTLLIETVAALLLSIRFIPEFGLMKGIWMSIFHAVSAFCNAGFDLMGQKEVFSSLTSYQNDSLVMIVIAFLIIIGGLGFYVWDDIIKYKFRFKKYRLQSKIVLITTFLLIVFPFLYFFLFEFSREEWLSMTIFEKMIVSFFESVTPRTAGFNSIDYSRLHNASIPIYITLMLIGGSSGSTAGGVKTTTLAVMIVTLISIFSKKDGIQVFNRRLPKDVILQAIAILSLYIGLFLIGGILLSIFETTSLKENFFEVSSALGTVGLTLGITSSLSIPSRIVLIILMYLGRVGSLTVLFALSADHSCYISTVPEEGISIG